ncbi:hypothetical protein F0562_025775 [Nyssa sinensis]|uniref:Hemerythrin-like domain-containing protein n=1 Tax=Nyssa sinensis TaxID=561372 RepID=A0A5J5B789_9ASTE|nr:hypothetical protein F0562_025775 [Nyssa sinensis]
MGNCFGTLKKSTSDIAPSDYIKGSPIVRLYGSPTCILTSHIRFALLYKPVSLHFIPSETPNFGSETPVLQFGSDTVSGSRETLLRYIDSKFPNPPLMSNGSRYDETTPLVVSAAILQHRSMIWHVERLVRWAEDLATRGGRTMGDPVMGSPRMEVRKFGRSYSQLLEVMLEHAQMEEKVVFPIMEMADRGLSKGANEEHARDLPIMNGIKEDIKSIGVLDSGSPVYQEALSNLSTRLKTLQEHCKEHFQGEERNLLPLMEATELSREQQERVLEQCLDAMQGTHSHLFCFFLEGLRPRDALQYLDLITRCSDRERVTSILHVIVE